jgi:immune inhibitor A
MAALALLLLVLGAVGAAGAGAGNTTAGGAAAEPVQQAAPEDMSSPLSDKQRALRQAALQMQVQGKIPKGAKVGKVAKGQYVELAREGEDSIFTILGQFGNTVNPTYGGSAGPQRNQIPQPDRATDNTTIWAPDFSKNYFANLLFSEAPGASSMRNFYIENSSGRYAVNGDVTDWVQVPNNEANYGSNYCGSIVCSRTWLFVRDAANAWYDGQIAAGKTPADINNYLKKFDSWDRYDSNSDGTFVGEQDHYIDHFQTIHAGVGEETGGGAQGTDAIWSHRWYAFYNNIGVTGPPDAKLGGIRIGNSDYWIGDYTIEPENGGVGVFSHEFGHDLGLPDEYDTSGNVGGAENSTGFWTTWSSGSYGNNGVAAEGIGDRPFQMSAWDKFQLGWLNYDATFPGDKKKDIKLGPAEANTKQTQAEIVVLPSKKVTVDLGAPHAGSKYFYSGTGNNLDTFMTKAASLPAGAQLTAQVRYNNEQDWDYAYVVVSTDNGATWTTVATNLSTATDPNGQNFGQGITGVQPNWTTLTASLPAGNVLVGFRYWTDGAQQGTPGFSQPAGFQIDDIAITGSSPDGAEAGASAWTISPATGGFHVTSGSETQAYFNAYVAENRQYLGFDTGLQTGPYNFGGNVGPNWAERFPYQDGLLVWYWDSSFADNNVGDHPGSGLILPIDARPAMLHFADGTLMRPRIQSFDSTFGVDPTDSIMLHRNGALTTIASQPAVPLFDDTNSYYVGSDPADGRWRAGWSSVNNPHTGTQIRVQSSTPGGFMQIQVTPAK